MYKEIVGDFETAVCDLLSAKKDSINEIMRSAHAESDGLYAIALGVYPWHESMEISFGTKRDYHEQPVALGEWKYYSVCNSIETPTESVAKAISTMVQFYEGDGTDDDDDEDPSEALARANVVFFAAAQALMSPRVWSVYNSFRLTVLDELRVRYEQEGRSLSFIDYDTELHSGDDPTLKCVVADGDATIQANYCEIIRSITMLKARSDEVLGAIRN